MHCSRFTPGISRVASSLLAALLCNRAASRLKLSGIDPMDAVELIRKKRRGAINRVQLKYVQDYTPVRRKSSGCAVM